MLVPTILFPHVVPNEAPIFDATPGLILFDQKLIICQQFNQISV
jgi:hypothetical protein